MASLCRGLLHPASPRIFLSPRPVLADLIAPNRSRILKFASPFRLKSTKTTPVSKPAQPAKPATPLSKGLKQKNVQSSYAIAKTMASSQSPTVLYEGPNHFWYYFGCWTSGASILAWTGLTASTLMNQPEGVPAFVTWVYGGAYTILAAMGLILLSKTMGLVQSIRAIPTPGSVSTTPPARQLSRQAQLPQLKLEVVVNRAMPFFPPKKVTTPIENVSLRSRFSLPEAYVPELVRQKQKREEEEKRVALHKFDMEHLLTMPFRRIGRAFVAMFRGVKSAWTDTGYGTIIVDGKSYKVNIVKGFALDGFRTLEKLVPVKTK